MISVLIGADVVPVEKNIAYFENGSLGSLIESDLLEVIREADFRVFNVEVPLTDVADPIKKCGPNLIASTKSVRGIKALDPSLVTLANNHIMDQGKEGFYSTIRCLSENGIPFVGVGKSICDAPRPYILEKNGIKTGFYACCEHEFSIADKNKPGANPFDSIDSLFHISELKKQCDYVVVLYHGGKEYYRYPSPNLQKACRAMCKSGADFVVCQHTHCVGCMEKFEESVIVYGQGNFHFNAYSNEFWDTGMLVKLSFTDKMTVDFVSIRQNGKGISLGDNKVIEDFMERSEQIKSEEFIEKKYDEFAANMYKQYLMTFKKPSLVYRVIDKICGHRLKYSIPEEQLLSIRNVTECEAHRELMLRSFKL